ncbi:MAG: hypothetical protein Kow00122_03130 [Thermoleophilia bacterium]
MALQHGLETAEGSPVGFTDLDDVYRDYVAAVAAAGWVAGYPDGRFRPYDPLQRQHMAVVFVRSLGLADKASSLTSAEAAAVLSRFADAEQITAEAAPYVAVAVTSGLMKGDTSGHFLPVRATTRAHFALVAYRAESGALAAVQGIRYSPDHPDRTRIVLDLSNPVTGFESQTGTGSLEGKLLVHLQGAIVPGGEPLSVALNSPEADHVAASQLSYRPQKVEVQVTLDQYSSYRVYAVLPSNGLGHRVVIDVYRKVETDGTPLVAIDAGHGGKDPGAVGVTGVKEKDVNLAIAQSVDGYLRQAGMKTLMTRTDDSYPTLEQRVDLANAAPADIFVSIHNNASADPGTSGTETFYWGDEDDYSVEGMRLAQAIQEAVCEELGSADRGARTHWKSLYVLGNTDMPAALVEVGFLTNPEEEAKLADPEYQDRAAKAVARGVIEYFEWDYVLE